MSASVALQELQVWLSLDRSMAPFSITVGSPVKLSVLLLILERSE